MAVKDWNPSAYAAFRSLRLRPALDLLAQVPDLPPGDVVDLGCGDGAAAGALAARFLGRRLVGVDASPAMLERATGYHLKMQADIADWQPDSPPALIFSNAALHWLDDHAHLFPRLAQALAPGGTLAVQMPANFDAPSHRLLRELAQELFPDRFDFTDWRAPTAAAAEYHRLLSGLGGLSIWETTYHQHLASVTQGHPVRAFTASTAMRPFLDRMSPEEATLFTNRYDKGLAQAYLPLPDGSVLFPFRRLFLILTRPA